MEMRYNTEFHRWEVYGPGSEIRAGELQPVYVSESMTEAAAYIERVRASNE